MNRRQFLSLAALAAVPRLAGSANQSKLRISSARQSLVGAGNPDTAVWSYNGTVPGPALRFRQGERLRIEVETSGEGLPVAEREKIFDAFKSVESARRQGGLGLGLQLARSIVEIHLGTIEVDNAGHGGVIFRIWLPVNTDSSIIRARASRPTLAADNA